MTASYEHILYDDAGRKVDWRKIMQERNQRRIDQQVERLSPALNEEQTSQYREHLESKSEGFLGGAIIGGSEGDIESHVEVIEIQGGGSE